MVFLNDRTDEEYYEHINITILDGNLINRSLINMEHNYGVILVMILYIIVDILLHFIHLHIHFK